ncbi:MAG TPA: MaoC family dehydratase [Deltaproteobacteria bacterium]|jgi:acyl dehydratase|nr:MaoC family dehydratase [Deltaproteobacteria bacterium]HIJ75614.1 MaoC family dehydratase [Deltaproteobacteria bacterium]
MNNSTSTIPIEGRCLEDFVVGSVSEFGSIAVEEAEIIDFARRFDPQVFHTDPEAAKRSIYGGLIASGWHTASMMMRLIVDHYLPGARSLGSPGIDELRWILPVRPGDELSIRVTVMEANRSRSKPDRGVVRSLVEVLNQNHEVVLTMKAINLLLCRDAQ